MDEIIESKDGLKGPNKVSFGEMVGLMPKFENDSEADASKLYKSVDTSDID